MRYILITLIFLTSSFSTVYAQSSKVKKAGDKYGRYAYSSSQELYLEAIKKGNVSSEVFKKLGDTYYYNAKYEQALGWFSKFHETFPDEMDADYMHKYAQTLKSVNSYKRANEILDEMFSKFPNDSRAKAYKSNPNYVEALNVTINYELESISINTEFSEFAPTFYYGNLIFSSNNPEFNNTKQRTRWNELPFYDLLINENGEVSNLSSVLNSSYHESTAVFTKDKSTVYFTRNNYTNNKYGKSNEGLNLLKLYKSQLKENGKWSKPVELPFNSDNYSVGHPALSPDEQTLYFSSDMEGSKGFSDIFSVSISEDTYGDPINLEILNTEGRETFPYVDANGDLYFSSDGHNGLGGLDIFKAEAANDFKSITNLGTGVNSPFDDMNFIIDSNTETGYLASNRKGGKGLDDIYSFKKSQIQNNNPQTAIVDNCTHNLKGTIKDNNTSAPISGALVYLLDHDGNILQDVKTDSNGNYTFDTIINCNKIYQIKGLKDGYLSNDKSFSTPIYANSLDNQDLFLNKNDYINQPAITSGSGTIPVDIPEINVGDDLASVLSLRPIYFDLNKSDIRPDAQVELGKVIAVLKKYPNMKIDVRSHTDSRGNDSSNLSLSQRRNVSTIDYLVRYGKFSRSRFTGKGYGESQLLNNCKNGVSCSESMHQLNLRSEFKVISVN